MNDILFLSHRIPYPPDKGDKIRAWHVLRHLAQRARVHVATFVDDPRDWEYVPRLRELGGECCVLPLSRPWATLRSSIGFITGEPLSMPYYRDRRLAAWLDAFAAKVHVDAVFVYSSTMAQHARFIDSPLRILDFCDVDSDKWTQFAARKPSALRWLYAREGRLLRASEGELAQDFDACLFVSDHEAELFRREHPEHTMPLRVLRNGVDSTYFDPANATALASPPPGPMLVFTGAMDYWANVDAVCWFADDVLPCIRERHPAACLYVVGSNPTAAVRELARRPGIVVTGRVPDVRPYLAATSLVVAPLRIARGVQNKVLEAMAMGRVVVGTSAAMAGIDGAPSGVHVADGAAAFAASVSGLLSAAPGELAAQGAEARRFVSRHYGWRQQLETLDRILDPPVHVPAPRGAYAAVERSGS